MDVSNIRNRKGQKLDAAYHAASNASYLAILGHGVTGNKDRPLLAGVAEQLAALGIPALRVSFAGNGRSEGSFGDVTIRSEAEDLVDLLDLYADSMRRIIYVGHSMGAAVGALVASKEPERIRILVSLAGMVHTGAFFRREFGDVAPGAGLMWNEPNCPLSRLAWDDAVSIGSTLAGAAAVAQPWLFVHGEEDDVVPISDSRDALAAAQTATKLVAIPGEGHPFSDAVYEQIAEEIAHWIGQSG